MELLLQGSAHRSHHTVDYLQSQVTKCIEPENLSPNCLQSGPQSGSLFDVRSFATKVV